MRLFSKVIELKGVSMKNPIENRKMWDKYHLEQILVVLRLLLSSSRSDEYLEISFVKV